MALKTEHSRDYYQQYYQKYRKKNKKKIKDIYSKYDKKNKEKRNRHYREKWKNEPDFREKRKVYFKTPRVRAKMKIIQKRNEITSRFKWNKMHISKKIIHRIDKILKEMEVIEFTGATDLKYWKLIKLRLDACKVLSDSWKKEHESLEGKA